MATDNQTLIDLATLVIDKGVEALPIISTVLLIVVMWFYRKDQREWRQQSREDLIAATQAIERNTSALNTISEISRVRLEKL